MVLVLPLFFAGSKNRLAAGTRIGGIDVGGLTAAQAKSHLTAQAARLATVPITFSAGGKQFRLTAKQLGTAFNQINPQIKAHFQQWHKGEPDPYANGGK